jgi:nitrite reductase/ring-hydroxylating ferredoxin subunit
MAVERPQEQASTEAPTWQPGFNEYLLGGVVLLALFLAAVGAAWYLLPGDHLQIPELQPAVRVASADMPDSASRVITWGPRVVLVVRSGDEFAALQGTSPIDGCILEWDRVSARVVSPCSYVVYDLHGNVVRGLTTVPLLRYDAFVRQGAVYVTEHR